MEELPSAGWARVVVTFALAEEAKTGCSGTLQTLAEDASHGGYIAGGISATLGWGTVNWVSFEGRE